MADITFPVGDQNRTGYLALPQGGRGPGVLVLHAWWGLTPFFAGLCDRLAKEGFVSFAPDLNHSKTADTIEEAEQILKERDFPAIRETAVAAVDLLRQNDAVTGPTIGVIGFSMGVAYAMMLNGLRPEAFSAMVHFYGLTGEDLTLTSAAIQGHFGETDEWEPISDVRQLKGKDLTVHIYPEAGHWFFEEDRPDAYQPEAAALAWDRTVAFLHAKLG